MGVLRAFLYAPSPRMHRENMTRLGGFVPRLTDAEVMDAAYRHSGGRQNAFAFAQGIVVGALGNLFASALGHFIDRQGPESAADAWWLLVGVLSLGIMASMATGALIRYRQNTQVERLFLNELRRRGGSAIDDANDPDELFEVEPKDDDD